MTTKLVKKSPTLVAAQTYLTSVRARSVLATPTAQLLHPGETGSETTDIVLSTTMQEFKKLARYNDVNDVGVSIDDKDAFFDDLTCKAWPGIHMKGETSNEPTLTTVGSHSALVLASKAASLLYEPDATDFAEDVSFSALFVLNRNVASFAGWAPVLWFGDASLTANELFMLEVNQDGALRVRGKVDGGSFAGRQTEDDALPNASTKVIAVSVKHEETFRISVNGVQADTTDIGTGTGVAPYSLVDWLDEDAQVIIGGRMAGALTTNAGTPRLLRLQCLKGVSHIDDPSELTGAIMRLRSEYGV